jgi:hypothetical protein
MKRFLIFPLVLTWITVAPAALRAEEDVLSLVPPDAYGFVVINHLETFSNKVQKLATQMQVPAPPLLPMMKGPLGIREGTNDDGNFAVVVMPGGEEDPMPVPFVLVPVTDYKKFVAQLQPDDAEAKIATVVVMGQTCLVANKKDYAVFTLMAHEEALTAFLAAKGSVAGSVAPIKAWIGGNDASWVLMHSGLTTLIEKLQESIDNFKQHAADNEQIAKIVAIQEVYLNAFNAIEGQVTNLGGGLRIDDEGNVRLSARGPFKPGASWAKRAEAIKPLANGPLFGLPDGEFVAALGGPIPEGLDELIGEMSTNAYRLNPARAKVPEDVLKNMREVTVALVRDARGMASLMSVGDSDDSLFSHSTSIIRVDDAKVYMENYRKSVELVKSAYAEMGIAALVKPLSVSGLEGVEVTMDMSAMMEKLGQDAGGGAPVFSGLFDKMFGKSGKITTYVAMVGSKAVVTATNQLDLKRLVDNVRARKPGLADSPDVVEATKLLPSGSQWLGYISPRGVAKAVGGVLAAFRQPMQAGAADEIVPAFELPEFPQTIPVPMAGKVSSAGFEGELVLPNKVLTSTADYVRLVIQKAMQAGQEAEVEIEQEEVIGE